MSWIESFSLLAIYIPVVILMYCLCSKQDKCISSMVDISNSGIKR